MNYSLLAAGVFFVGLYPQPIINVLRVTIGHLLLESIPSGLALNVPSSIYVSMGSHPINFILQHFVGWGMM